MFIYNITTKVNEAIHEQWLLWMKEKHIPEVMGKGCFTEYRFAKLVDLDESDGFTYTVQYVAVNRDQYERYVDLFADALRKDLVKNWGNNTVAFYSLMELVN